ncbi:putative disease resistance protein At4g19050 [Malus domestica]|uniref:putative disease resistance protein At4g19050 n=1 Tax=Malus domestica TaxID=3750 RepID=UPI003976AFF9
MIEKSDARELEESQAVRLLLKKSKNLTLRKVKNFSVLTDLDQEGFQDLKDLDLRYCPHIEYLANGTSGFLTNLRIIQLKFCGVLKYVFSLSVARNLVQLQELNIYGCDQMEEIVSKQGREHEEEADIISFHKLTNLTLEGLGSLVGFFQANKLYSNQEEEKTARVEHQSAGIFEKAIFPSTCISWFPSLEKVRLGFMEFEGVLFDLKIHVVMDGQTAPTFPQLRGLEIIFCSFTHLWKNIPSGFQGFRNLRCLDIRECCGLKYVFSHLIARELLNLEEVKISRCPDMETIVRIKEQNEEEATKHMILFPKLNTFELQYLPRLTSLCPEGFTFLWSSIKNMHVNKCENLKTLVNNLKKDSTSHDFSTSPTRSSNWCPAGCGCAPYSRPNAHRPIEILPRPINLEITPTNLEDSNDDDNLENLTVSDCNSMEVIFQLKGPKHEESSHSVEAFNKLSSLQLYTLPSLTRVWETGSSQPMFTGSSFGNLKSLRVYYCNQLKYLFSSSIVKLLVSVENIEVQKCEQMEEIIAAEEETAEIITLPKVKSIKLLRLPKLKYFCGEAYTLKLPSLELLKVTDVQNLSLLAPKLTGTHPRLQVRTALGVAEWKGDLNATLRNIYVTRKGEDDEIDRKDEHN